MTVNSEPVEMSQVNFGADGLIPAVCQHYETGQVLVLAFMNKASFHKTLELGQAVFWSRSRQEIWHKGATSGNYLNVRSIRVNCEHNSILILCDPVGATCHTGQDSCFFRSLNWESPPIK
jgi:phosphoribosyl-ATP pyrophosphohydrolase/phosphoribosyl-AMP cyclohydrolase